MDAVEASAPLYAPREEVYEFVEGYRDAERFSEHVEQIERYGDGGSGTDFRISLSWWRLSWTAHSRVLETDPPEEIAWRVAGEVRARGWWRLAELDAGRLPGGEDAGTELTLRIEFDPETLYGHSVTRVLPLERLLERVKPVVVRECESMLSAVAADLEGEPRPVEYTVRERPETLPV